MSRYLFVFETLLAFRRALLDFANSDVAFKGPALFRDAVPGALRAATDAECAILANRPGEAQRALFVATTYLKGCERIGALALAASIAQMEGVRGQILSTL